MPRRTGRRITRVVGHPERARSAPPRARYASSTGPQSACAPVAGDVVDPAADEHDPAAARADARPRRRSSTGAAVGTPSTPGGRVDGAELPVDRRRAATRSDPCCGVRVQPAASRRTAAAPPVTACCGDAGNPGAAPEAVVRSTDRAADRAVAVDPHALVVPAERGLHLGAGRPSAAARRADGDRRLMMRPPSPRAGSSVNRRIVPIEPVYGREPRRHVGGGCRSRSTRSRGSRPVDSPGSHTPVSHGIL